jgi:hypothetical protein
LSWRRTHFDETFRLIENFRVSTGREHGRYGALPNPVLFA